MNDGSTRIEIRVEPGEVVVKDVHLCVARTVSGEEAEVTRNGDPMATSWRAWPLPAGTAPPAGVPAAAGLPANWTYRGVQRHNNGNDVYWCHTWTAPNNPLANAGTFTIDYKGDLGELKKSEKANLFLTKNGADNFVRADVVNGPGRKGEKGHMPQAVFSGGADPLPPN